MEDGRLLKEWVEQGSEAAFAALLNRHLNLVYSAALRRVKDHAVAEEVVQSVFGLLARKAAHLRSDTALVSWLYRTACFKASRAWRDEQRRHRRELEAASMNSNNLQERDGFWQQLAPCLDEAMQQLGEMDRLAILLRFFQGKQWQEIGKGLGIGEDAARMRVGRAVERLRAILEQKGVVCPVALLGPVLLDRAVQLAPASLVHSVEAAGIAAAKAGSSSAWVLGVLSMLAKAKFAAFLAAVLTLLLGVNWAVHAQRKLQKPGGTNGLGSIGPISFSVRSFGRDPGGGPVGLVAIRNRGTLVLDYAYAGQIQVVDGWADTNGNLHASVGYTDPYSVLEPGEERCIAFGLPALPSPWRVTVACVKHDDRFSNEATMDFYSPTFGAFDARTTNSVDRTTNPSQTAQESNAMGRREALYRHPKLALPFYDEAVRLNPTNALYYLYRGGLRGSLHDSNGAIADLKKAIELSAGRPTLREEAQKWKAELVAPTEDEQYEDLEGERR